MLTPLEISTLDKLANGELIKNIAAFGGVSHSAVDKRIENIKRKLNARTICECVYKASKAGLICLLITSIQILEHEIIAHPDDFGDIGRRSARNAKSNRKPRDLSAI
jgi:DNA-binding CsgD family transcriptional regulator